MHGSADPDVGARVTDHGDYQRWSTSHATRKGLVFFFHGFGLYAEKFASLFTLLNDVGYDVVAHDTISHGRHVDRKLTIDTIDDAAAFSLDIYDKVADERPILMGVGTFGGYMMCRVMDAKRDASWDPPCVFYSVEYVPIPYPILAAVQRRRLLRQCDRLLVGYNHHHLTHDVAENIRFVEHDPRCRTKFPLGLSLHLGHVTNTFYESKLTIRRRHAMVIGTEDKISNLKPLRRCVKKQPRFRLFEVQGGAFHLHRDRPQVVTRFRREIAAALDYVSS